MLFLTISHYVPVGSQILLKHAQLHSITFCNVRIKSEVSYYLLWISFIPHDFCSSCVVCVQFVSIL